MQVVFRNLPTYGFKNPFTIVQPIKVTVRYQGTHYDVYLAQYAKRGPGGVWVITAVEPHGTPPTAPKGPVRTPTAAHPYTGTVPHRTADVAPIQRLATAGNPADTYYLNPVQVVERNLAPLGYTEPVPLAIPLKIGVAYRANEYTITLRQPVKKGVTGIWLITDIARGSP